MSNSAGVGVLAETTSTGTAFRANHTGASGDIAQFQSGGTTVARIDKTGKGYFTGGIDGYATSATLSDAGTINTGSNPVDWTKLKNVPTGFSDGTDNDTTYSAGSGLALSGTQFSADFAGSGSATTVARSDHRHATRAIVMTAGEALTAGQPLYYKASDGKVYKASGNAAGEAAYNFIGFAGTSVSSGSTLASILAPGEALRLPRGLGLRH